MKMMVNNKKYFVKTAQSFQSKHLKRFNMTRLLLSCLRGFFANWEIHLFETKFEKFRF